MTFLGIVIVLAFVVPACAELIHQFYTDAFRVPEEQ